MFPAGSAARSTPQREFSPGWAVLLPGVTTAAEKLKVVFLCLPEIKTQAGARIHPMVRPGADRVDHIKGEVVQSIAELAFASEGMNQDFASAARPVFLSLAHSDCLSESNSFPT